jgi:hypothetical protein
MRSIISAWIERGYGHCSGMRENVLVSMSTMTMSVRASRWPIAIRASAASCSRLGRDPVKWPRSPPSVAKAATTRVATRTGEAMPLTGRG